MSEQMTVKEAMRLMRDYVCSQCWGQIVVTFRHGESTVTCDKCGVITAYVTRKYADRRRQESVFELWEARDNLKSFIKSKPKEDIF